MRRSFERAHLEGRFGALVAQSYCMSGQASRLGRGSRSPVALPSYFEPAGNPAWVWHGSTSKLLCITTFALRTERCLLSVVDEAILRSWRCSWASLAASGWAQGRPAFAGSLFLSRQRLCWGFAYFSLLGSFLLEAAVMWSRPAWEWAEPADRVHIPRQRASGLDHGTGNPRSAVATVASICPLWRPQRTDVLVAAMSGYTC